MMRFLDEISLPYGANVDIVELSLWIGVLREGFLVHRYEELESHRSVNLASS